MKNPARAQIKESTGNVHFTAGERWPGGALELVASTDTPGASELLWWRRGKAVITLELEYQGETYRAMPLPPVDLLLPRRTQGSGEIRPIFEQMCKILQKLCALPEAQAGIVGFWVISTWFADCLFAPPVLSVYGANMTRAMHLFRVLRCLCRRGLLIAGLTPGKLQGLPWAFQPTLLLTQPSRNAQNLLLASSFQDVHVPTPAGDFQNFSCPKAIFTGSAPLPPLWATQTIALPLSPLDDGVVRPSERMLAKVADYFQPRMLTYRLKRWAEVRNSRFVATGLRSPLREVASTLGSCIQGDDDLAARFVTDVPEPDADQGADLLDVALLEVLWPRLHRRAANQAPVEIRIKAELAKDIATFVLAAGDDQKFTAEMVGIRIALLGFDTKRDQRGSKVQLTPQTSRRIHQLASKLDPLKSVSGCPDCEQMLAERQPDPAAETVISKDVEMPDVGI
jgi:hypothetical protein